MRLVALIAMLNVLILRHEKSKGHFISAGLVVVAMFLLKQSFAVIGVIVLILRLKDRRYDISALSALAGGIGL